MKIKKSTLVRLIKEAFEVPEPTSGTGEMLSSEHQMMTMLVRKIYKNLDDPESFFRNIDLIEDALSRSSNIQGDIARKFFTLEGILGNLQRIHEGNQTIIDLDSSGQEVEYDEFGMPVAAEDDFESDVITPFDDDESDIPL